MDCLSAMGLAALPPSLCCPAPAADQGYAFTKMLGLLGIQLFLLDYRQFGILSQQRRRAITGRTNLRRHFSLGLLPLSR
ncbi:MAG: hypothetical protein R3C44_13045 [Chloroflexota bacterium]